MYTNRKCILLVTNIWYKRHGLCFIHKFTISFVEKILADDWWFKRFYVVPQRREPKIVGTPTITGRAKSTLSARIPIENHFRRSSHQEKIKYSRPCIFLTFHIIYYNIINNINSKNQLHFQNIRAHREEGDPPT